MLPGGSRPGSSGSRGIPAGRQTAARGGILPKTTMDRPGERAEGLGRAKTFGLLARPPSGPTEGSPPQAMGRVDRR